MSKLTFQLSNPLPVNLDWERYWDLYVESQDENRERFVRDILTTPRRTTA